MQNLAEILTNTKPRAPIGPIGDKLLKPYREKPQTNVIVDRLLADYADLIDPRYKPWFAKRFYNMGFDQVHRAASEARQEGTNPQCLFAHKIGKLYNGLKRATHEPAC